MYGNVESSGGYIEVTDYSQVFDVENPLENLKIFWTSDTVANNPVSIYINDSTSPIFCDLPQVADRGLHGLTYCFEIKDIAVHKFKIEFSSENTNRYVNYYGYY